MALCQPESGIWGQSQHVVGPPGIAGLAHRPLAGVAAEVPEAGRPGPEIDPRRAALLRDRRGAVLPALANHGKPRPDRRPAEPGLRIGRQQPMAVRFEPDTRLEHQQSPPARLARQFNRPAGDEIAVRLAGEDELMLAEDRGAVPVEAQSQRERHLSGRHAVFDFGGQARAKVRQEHVPSEADRGSNRPWGFQGQFVRLDSAWFQRSAFRLADKTMHRKGAAAVSRGSAQGADDQLGRLARVHQRLSREAALVQHGAVAGHCDAYAPAGNRNPAAIGDRSQGIVNTLAANLGAVFQAKPVGLRRRKDRIDQEPFDAPAGPKGDRRELG
jgi:hypothetical protein